MDTHRNAALFRRAHALCRKTIQPGDSYQITFGACLKHLYARAKVARQVQEHMEIIQRLVRKTLQQRDWLQQNDAGEDLEQDVILQLLEGAPYDPSRGTPQTWIYWALRAVVSRTERQATSYHHKRQGMAAEQAAERQHRQATTRRSPGNGLERRTDLRLVLGQATPTEQAEITSRLLDEGDRATRKRLGQSRKTRDRHLRRMGARYEEAA